MRVSLINFIHKYILLLVVFLTGGAILILEVVATRILSVYFGNTIYTVSSVISVILFALSAGYFTGGRLADKKVLDWLFYRIILVSGFAVWIIYLLNLFIIPKISYSLSLREGPLVVSILLFFLPSFLLGILSPLCVTLQNRRRKEGIGRTTGDVFFWSTLGSITGSLTCGFLLIPLLGIDMILIGVGVLLIIIAIFGMSNAGKNNFGNKMLLFILISFPLVLTLFITLTAMLNNNDHIFTTDGVYSKITIFDGTYNGKPARFLRQNLDKSSASYLDSPELVYDYTKYYELYKFVNPDLENALVIGAGAYSVPKALLLGDARTKVDVVDIEPLLFDTVKKYFNIPEDPRLKNYIEDGRRFLHDNQKKYDLIYSDAFSFTIPAHLATREFFQLSKNRLNPKGLFIVNTYGTIDDNSPSFAFSEIKTFRDVYPNSYFFAVTSPDFDIMQNIMLVGVNSEKKVNFVQLPDDSDPFLQTVSDQLMDINKYKLSNHIIFTDNYAPIEYYMSKIL